jgi:hypothetical protein
MRNSDSSNKTGSPKMGSKRPARAKQPDGASREARRLAAVILEVLAGMRTPTEAAQAVSVSVPRYYALEQRAIAGLVAACEPRGRGPTKSPKRQIAELEREVQRLRQQSDRHLALARAAQRSVGLAAPPRPTAGGKDKPGRKSKSSGRKRSRRRPTIRALKAVKDLKEMPPDEPAPASETAEAVSAAVNPSSGKEHEA